MSNGDDLVLVRPVSAREDVETLSSQDRSLLARWLADSAECEDIVASRLGRRVGLVVTVGGAVLLIPWVSELATTLPDHHSAHQWRIAWTGFDVALTLAFAMTRADEELKLAWNGDRNASRQGRPSPCRRPRSD